jgi:hypothetical protein
VIDTFLNGLHTRDQLVRPQEVQGQEAREVPSQSFIQTSFTTDAVVRPHGGEPESGATYSFFRVPTFSLVWPTLNPAQNRRNPAAKSRVSTMIAEAGFEPTTFGL